MNPPEQAMNALMQVIDGMAMSERLRLVERIVREVAAATEHAAAHVADDRVMGLFSDEAALIDEIHEGAMVARELDLLRRQGA